MHLDKARFNRREAIRRFIYTHTHECEQKKSIKVSMYQSIYKPKKIQYVYLKKKIQYIFICVCKRNVRIYSSKTRIQSSHDLLMLPGNEPILRQRMFQCNIANPSSETVKFCQDKLVWLVVEPYSSKNIKVSWDYYSQYTGKTCSKPPTSSVISWCFSPSERAAENGTHTPLDNL